MKVAIISRPSKEVKPTAVSGISVFVYGLAEELAKRPDIESVTVLGVGNNYFTNDKINFVSLLPQIPKEFSLSDGLLKKYPQTAQRSDLLLSLYLKAFNYLAKHQFDIIHDNSTSSIFTSLSHLLPSPLVTTIHTHVTANEILIPYAFNVFDDATIGSHPQFVVISDSQKELLARNSIPLNLTGRVYNGINLSNFTPNYDTANSGKGLWLGRIGPEDNKGLHQVLAVREKLDEDIVLIGAPDEEKYTEAFTTEVPIIDGRMDMPTKTSYYMQAAYFIYPLKWDEPFGLVFLESMACGTPVIAYARGAVPEIITDGETGFIVNSSEDDKRGDWIVKKTGIEGLCEAVQRLHALSPEAYKKMRMACRKRVEDYFSAATMAEEYEKIYKKLI